MLYQVMRRVSVIDPETGEPIWLEPGHPYRAEEPRHASFIDQARDAFVPWGETRAAGQGYVTRVSEEGYVSDADWAAWSRRIQARRDERRVD